MSGQNLYYPWADIARDAGLVVKVTGTNSGWERRARSSGGFPAAPLGVMWHHAASSNNTSDEACVNYQVRGNPDNPVGNMTLGRNGDLWPVAGGASNCSGKGGPMQFSRGTCPLDQGNTYLVNVEVNNDGVGGAWSQQLIDCYFILSNAVNAYLGNRPDDITSHALGKGNGYTNRKIDPATAGAVQGPWQPRSVNANGTWDLDDMRAECLARAGQPSPGPGPGPEPGPEPAPGDWPNSLINALPTLTPGSDNYWMVKRMQHLLAAAGAMNEANTANYDGAFGSGTANALNNFKTRVGGAADSTCDSWTWGALLDTGHGGLNPITKGAKGPAVKRMQHLLAACGFMNEANTGNYDGVWGGGTENAKINFDNAAGLAPSPPTDCGNGSWTQLMVS